MRLRRQAANKQSESFRANKARRIEVVAYQLYLRRLRLNRPGNQSGDWLLAKRIVSSSLSYRIFQSRQLSQRFYNRCLRPFDSWLNNHPLISIFGIVGSMLGNIGIVVAVAIYVFSEEARREANIYQAWQTITNAHGQSGSGGRRRSLEFLNASPKANWRRKFPWVCTLPRCLWPAENLDGVNLSAESSSLVRSPSTARNLKLEVFLDEIELPYASLNSANFKGASLWDANLEGAKLKRANLDNTDLYAANLKGAVLQEASLQEASLMFADLEAADLMSANMTGAVLENATLTRAVLRETNLQDASLIGAIVASHQIEKALLCRTQLPDGIMLDGNRDCQKRAESVLE